LDEPAGRVVLVQGGSTAAGGEAAVQLEEEVGVGEVGHPSAIKRAEDLRSSFGDSGMQTCLGGQIVMSGLRSCC
jgi:hypothetical protein